MDGARRPPLEPRPHGRGPQCRRPPGKGWEAITTAAVTAVAQRTDGAGRQKPLVAILWGKDAESVVPLLEGAPSVVSVHPSPLSASRGFFGSKPFSRTNALLVEQGAEPVDWELPVL